MEDEIKVTPWGIVAALFIAVLVIIAALLVWSLRADAYIVPSGEHKGIERITNWVDNRPTKFYDYDNNVVCYVYNGISCLKNI